MLSVTMNLHLLVFHVLSCKLGRMWRWNKTCNFHSLHRWIISQNLEGKEVYMLESVQVRNPCSSPVVLDSHSLLAPNLQEKVAAQPP